MKQYIPRIDLDRHLKKYPPEGIANFHIDNLAHILNLITEIPSRSDSHDLYNGYVPLNSTLLRKKIRNYNQYLDYLVASGVLLCDNYYIKEEKSRGYKFNEEYFTKVEPYEITKYTLIKSIKAGSRENKTVPKKYEYLVNWFDDLALDPSAFDYLNNKYPDPLNEESINKYNSAFRNLNWIQDNDYYFSVDTTGNRFHSNLTSLNSDLRKFLLSQNQPLVAVDIKNSQPYLSIILLNPSFYQNNTDTFNIYNINTYNTSSTTIYNPSNIYTTTTNHPQFSPPPMLHKTLEEIDNQDVKNYIELVENGLIYEYLANEIKDELGEDLRDDRKAIKAIVFTILYTANQFIGQPEATPKRLFRDRFPTVYKVFSAIKREDKKTLAILLQRIEAYLVLDKICPRITQERPKLPIYTIHDSIVTTLGNEEYVKAIMEEELTATIGHKPSLKIEYWSISQDGK